MEGEEKSPRRVTNVKTIKVSIKVDVFRRQHAANDVDLLRANAELF